MVSAQETTVSDLGAGQSSKDIKLYPNPVFDDVVYITTDLPGSKEISIYDVFGKVAVSYTHLTLPTTSRV